MHARAEGTYADALASESKQPKMLSEYPELIEFIEQAKKTCKKAVSDFYKDRTCPTPE